MDLIRIYFSQFTGCELPAGWNIASVGNGYCEDAVNNLDCNYDGGDCCGSNVSTDICTKCICFEDLNCPAPLEVIGNGFCNDETNNAECNFDGGDCCGIIIQTEYCTQCICQEELYCSSHVQLVGNGFCNDETNTLQCNYDGGDCCLANANITFCTECNCQGIHIIHIYYVANSLNSNSDLKSFKITFYYRYIIFSNHKE